MGILERFLGFLSDRAERGRQKRVASRCSDARTAAEVVKHFVKRPESTELVIDSPEGKALFTRADIGRLQHAGKSTVGEQVFAHMMTGGAAYGFPGTWTSDRYEQVVHCKMWVFNAIRAIWQRIGRHEPNVAFVEHGGGRNDSRLKMLWQRSPNHARAYGDYILRKSLHAVKPHETVTPAGPDHPLVQRFRRPNAHDVSFDLWNELGIFLELTGITYLWAVPSKWGVLDGTLKAAELWVIPSHWVYPHVGRDRIVEYYEIRPWVGSGTVRLPPEDVICFKYKSPISKIDGFSPLVAGAEIIDTQESVNRSRFWQFKNGCFPLGQFKMGASYNDLDDDGLERFYAKIFARFQGEQNYGRPMVAPPDVEYVPLMVNPQEMAYFQTSDQLREYILSLWSVPKELLGIQSAASEVAVYGPLRSFSENALIPRLTYLGQVLTEKLAKRWDSRLRVWWDDPAGEDPEQRRADMKLLYDCQAISPNEMRSQYGLEPWAHGGDDPMAPSSIRPLPLETGGPDPFAGQQQPGMGNPQTPGASAPALPPARPGLPLAASHSTNGRVAHA